MNKFTERRLKENEVIFREANKDVLDYVEEETGSGSTKVEFYCECSRKQCRSRIEISTQKYRQLHSSDRQFIALPGHETPQIERIIKKEDGFNVVEKYGSMPSPEAIDLALAETTRT